MKKISKENWVKVGCLALLLIAISVAYNYFFYIPQKDAVTTSLVRQEQCSTQAEKGFADSGWKDTAVYTNHFNSKLNKCFLLISKITPTDHGGISTYKVLTDVLENKVYAEYGDSAYGAVPYTCTTLDAQCSNKTMFDSFVAEYMNG